MVVKLPIPKKVLRPHQRIAFQYCEKVQHPFLAMEMRLGKCLVTIRRVKKYKPLDPELGLRIIVVSPSDAIAGWENELTSEGEDYVVLQGRKVQCKRELLSNFTHRWYLLNKEGFLWLEEIASCRWDAVIIDESFIRSPKSKVTRFFTRNFRDCPHRWLLTGTPNPESDLELFPQLQWLDGHAFGFKNYWDFRASSFEVKGYEWQPTPGTKTFIDEYLGKRALVMRRSDAGVQIEKIVHLRTFDFPDDIRRSYDECERTFTMDERTTIWSTVKYIWLRQLCGGIIDGQVKWTGKFDSLISILLTELQGSQTVIWFNYNNELFEAERRLRKLGIPSVNITGSVDRNEREKRRRAFQSGRARVILCQELAVRMGTDLSSADTCIYFSRNPSAITDAQTQDRIVSLSKTGSLLYIYMVVKGTVDEDLHQAMNAKRLNSSVTLNAALRHFMRGRIHGKESQHSEHRQKLLNRFLSSRRG